MNTNTRLKPELSLGRGYIVSMDHKVNPTILARIEDIEHDYQIKSVFVKDESRNPFGTIKDRRNLGIIENALRAKVDKLVLVTSGNNGYSLAKLASMTTLKVVMIVNRSLSAHTKADLRAVCYQLIEVNLDDRILRTEEIISFARERDDEVIWDVTNGFEHFYEPVVSEILHKTLPDFIVVPIGSGGIFVGIVEALKKYNSFAKVIGIGVQNTLHSFADKLSCPTSPYTKVIQSYIEQGHFVYNICEDDVKKTYNQFKNVVRCDSSSAVVFSALSKFTFKPKHTVVFLNSGKSVV